MQLCYLHHMDDKTGNEDLIYEFFDVQPYALLWLKPLFNEAGKIVDFSYDYGNKEGLQYLQLNPELLKKITIFNSPSLTDEMRSTIFNEIVCVYQTGKTSETMVYNPVINRYGKVFRTKFREGILTIIHDNTQEHAAIHQLEKQTNELERQRSFSSSILDASPDGIFALETVFDAHGGIEDFIIVKINRAFTEITGKAAIEVEGKSYLESFPSSKKLGTFELNCQVIKNGQAIRKELFYKGDGLEAWFDVSLVKWNVNGIVITFSNITARKRIELEQEQHNELIQTMLNASFHGKALLEPVSNKDETIVDFRVIAANNSTEKQLGISPSAAIGELVSVLLPGYKNNGSFELYKRVIHSGTPEREEHFYKDQRFEGWFDVYVAPVTKGIVVSFANITERKKEALQIQQQKNLLDTILAYSPSGISVTEIIKDENDQVIDGRTLLANEAAIRYVGIPKELYLKQTAREIDPGIMESALYQMAVKTLETGISFHTQYYLDAAKRWLELSVAKMDESHLINVFTDVTATKEVQLQVEQFAEKLHTIINTSQAGFFLGSPVLNEVGTIINFRFTMVNQVLAYFVGKAPEELIGELGSDWFVAYKKNGLFERFKETYLSGIPQQFDIFYQGETVEVWANVKTTKLGEELLGTFTDFTQIKTLQLQLEKSVDELRRSNKNLEEFAYAASHDLQEPLRKISFFAEQLRKDLGSHLTDDISKKFDRMLNAARRMRSLINDLLEYSKVSVRPDVFEDVELSDVVEQVLQDMEATILATSAEVIVENLPQIKGDETQLTHVFQNIISNALKYRKANQPPVVLIKSKVITEADSVFSEFFNVAKGDFYLIEISDNGIGFDQEYSEKIFQVFQRLHGRGEYAGTGVGLAIVQKVIANHKGYIIAQGESGKGATFKILFPVN